MRHANLLLHTARAEGLPNVLLEAQAAGLPLLTTSAGGCVEAIDPGITGVVLDTRNPEDLAREAVRLLRSPEWLANAREEGPGFVRQHFSLEAMLDKTWAVYGLPKAPPSSEGRPMSSEGPVILPRPLVWTPELVTRFWDGMARAGLDEVMAFGRMARRCILWLVGRHLVPGGRHLDYGSGGGEVAAYLIEHGFPFAVLEPSVERQRSAESRLSSLAGFLGCPGPEDVGGYDAVTCFEVLEHVLDDRFEAVCDEIASYVRPGGRLIISTPNNEDLARDTVYCPVSNHTFHRWQHVRRIDQKTLESAFARRGFRKVCTHQLDFDENLFQPYLYLMGLAEPAAGSAKQMPLHIHQVLNDIDGVMGGATRLLHVAVKEG
jgi:SAM-dependent methyltransferase